MKHSLIFLLVLSISVLAVSQEPAASSGMNLNGKLNLSAGMGLAGAYADKAFQWSAPITIQVDYYLKHGLFLQFAPSYSWYWRWNDHYLTFPLHLGKRIGNKWSVYAGPALSLDVGYFKDLGISAGFNYHITEQSVLRISAYTFTLYDYHIDYLMVPVSVGYHYVLKQFSRRGVSYP